MAKEHWLESNDPGRIQRGVAGSLVLWIIGGVLLFGLIGVGIWGFKVLTSDVKGEGDAIRTKNSGTNRIAASERFEERYQDIRATDRKIDAAAAALKADPDSNVAQTNYTGLVNYCIDAVAEYNADARKYTAEAFRAEDLPAVIDNLDATTDCKETAS